MEGYFLIHGELMDAERQWALANKVPYADVISAMNSDRQDLVTWVHLNAAGNRIVASTLADVILKNLSAKGLPIVQQSMGEGAH